MPPLEPTFPRPYRRPQVPAPYDSVDQVHGFLAEFLYALHSKHDREAADTDATKLDTDGRGLYEVAKEEWLAQYGIKGLTIYNHLRKSKYGVMSSTAYVLSLYYFDSFLTLFHFFLFNSYLKFKRGVLGQPRVGDKSLCRFFWRYLEGESLIVVGKLFSVLGLAAGVKQAITNKAFGGNTFFIISPTAAIAVYIFFYFFGRECIIESRAFPERLKRRSTGVAEETTTWGLQYH